VKPLNTINFPLVSSFVDDHYVGRYVLVRTYASGVHFGKLKIYNPDNSHCILEDARRLYSWVDRLTLTEVSENGVTEKALMSIFAPHIMIGDVIEILLVSEKAEATLSAISSFAGRSGLQKPVGFPCE